jgi:plastocyanin
MKYKMLFFSMLLLLISAVGVISCGKSSSYNSGTGPGGGTPPPAGNSVNIQNMAFAAASLTIKAGTTVTWTNKDAMTHTVTADDASFDSGNLANGGVFSKNFPTAGTFTYHCAIHPGMKGTITVN